MQVFIIGLVVMVGYGLFLLLRAMLRLFRAGEKKLVCAVAVFMVTAPLLVWLSGFIPEERNNMWIALPTLILFLVWICAGYFLESYRKNSEKEQSMGIGKRPQAPPNLLRRNAAVFAAGLALWLYGAIVGVPNRTVEISLLCISVLLLTSSIGSFWKYRKF